MMGVGRSGGFCAAYRMGWSTVLRRLSVCSDGMGRQVGESFLSVLWSRWLLNDAGKTGQFVWQIFVE